MLGGRFFNNKASGDPPSPGMPQGPGLDSSRAPGHPGIQDGGDSRMRGCGEEGFLCVFGMLAFPAMGPPTAQQLLASPCHRRRQTTRDQQGGLRTRVGRARVGRDANAARWLTDRREVLGGVCGPESRFSDDVQTPPPVPRPEGSRPVTPHTQTRPSLGAGHLLVICDSASEARADRGSGARPREAGLRVLASVVEAGTRYPPR